MTSLVRSEVIKLVSTRTFYGLAAGAIAVVLLGTTSTLMSADPGSLDGPLHEQPFYFLASINAGLFALVLGIRLFTDEFRHGTIITTLLASGSRLRVLAAKVIVAGLGGALIAGVAEAAMAGAAVLLSSSRGPGLDVTSADVAGMLGMALALMLWAAVGVALGGIVRHQVAAIVGGIVWVLVVENLGSSMLGDFGRYLPGQAAHALARSLEIGRGLTVPLAAVVLGVYLLVAASGAALSLVRRDVA